MCVGVVCAICVCVWCVCVCVCVRACMRERERERVGVRVFNQINIMADDALAPYVARTSAAMILTK